MLLLGGACFPCHVRAAVGRSVVKLCVGCWVVDSGDGLGVGHWGVVVGVGVLGGFAVGNKKSTQQIKKSFKKSEKNSKLIEKIKAMI